MPANKNQIGEDRQLESVVHGLTEHVERIHGHVSADDPSSAWHELEKLKSYLERTCDPS